MSSYLSTSIPALYRRFSKERKREYEERINVVDAGSFTPMIASSTGGMCPEIKKKTNLIKKQHQLSP